MNIVLCFRNSMAAISALALLTGLTALAAPEIQDGPFRPDEESLRQYRCPEWFRDAKFGIWSHWGPQSVPMEGDWYARHMYVPGHRQYKHHLETYGHPSTNGWKDIVPLWKAEKFDPDRLMALYKKAGAKYFVSMGVHHDNFDLWNSKYQRWNAVNVGPHRDIVGAWQNAAKQQGLYFGVSEHLGASFWWWQVNKQSDPDGPFKGIPYDGVNPEWEDLYHWKAASDDTNRWYSSNPRWQQRWFLRIRNLVDSYHPDLLYTDGGVPFGNEVGLGLIAHYYNSDPERSGRDVHVVYTCKQRSEGRWVQDIERGVMSGINPDPWQTDTSIGDWYYNKHWKFRPVSWTIHMLVDIVSKNGNLLLNVVQRPDGSLDPEVERDLAALATWIGVNGEGIYGTRPWLVYGEGPIRAKGGGFKEDFAYSARDIRFTTKGENTLYAFALGWPEDGKIVVHSLGKFPGVTGRVTRVQLLGSDQEPEWNHAEEGLQIKLPARKPCDYAVAFKISVENSRGFKPELAVVPAAVIKPDVAGVLSLMAETADVQGDQLKLENQGGQPNLGFWDRAQDYASWRADFPKPGRYTVTASGATVHSGPDLLVQVGDTTLRARIPRTGAWDTFQIVELGGVEIKSPGVLKIDVRPANPRQWQALNLRWVKFTPAP